ncbi:MAG: hypothetical protein JW726_06755 [Anaerolineales bacterium]|nr:hypothetical protein [Anaerolineales bacterium]
MDTTTKKFLLACGIIIVVICLCLSVLAIGLAVWLVVNPSGPSLVSPDQSTPQVEQSVEEIEQQMDVIQDQVIAIRGLQPTGLVERTLLTPEELRQHVLDNFLDEYTAEEAADDALALSAFGLLEDDFDLHTFYVDLYSEQIAGFYDQEVKAMYVVKGSGFWGPERLTYAHEYTHVLQDQIYDIQNGLMYSEEACEQDSERCAAISSLMEGDATMVETAWFEQYASREDQQQVVQFYNSFESPVYESAPAFMKEDFLFPYSYGLEFVQSLYDAGGWQAVDDAYVNHPVSTEQILHPERYPGDVPQEVVLPDLLTVLGEEWRELYREVVGEWYTYLILAYGLDPDARLGTSDAAEAAEGWGGDAYAVYHNPQTQGVLLVIDWVWDTPADADEFAAAFEDYASARFDVDAQTGTDYQVWDSPDAYVIFCQDGTRTSWILAPDAATAELVWTAIAER